ncbi:unnamed protein product [Gordionus sp. m RMFG-2023]
MKSKKNRRIKKHTKSANRLKSEYGFSSPENIVNTKGYRDRFNTKLKDYLDSEEDISPSLNPFSTYEKNKSATNRIKYNVDSGVNVLSSGESDSPRYTNNSPLPRIRQEGDNQIFASRHSLLFKRNDRDRNGGKHTRSHNKTSPQPLLDSKHRAIYDRFRYLMHSGEGKSKGDR